jgi:hypothetical protein
MGGSVMLLMYPGEIKKVKPFLDKSDLKAPLIGNQTIPCDCWDESVGNKIELGYTFGNGFLNAEWANAIAIEIIKRFKVKKAGWDCIGYCDNVNEVKNARPFHLFIDQKGIVGLITPKRKLKLWQKIFEDAAIKIFNS